MKVILKKDIPTLGFAGDIKDVKNGYARNYLLPEGLVITADARSKKEMAFLTQVRKQKLAKREKAAKELSSKMTGIEVRITARLGEDGKMFGSVTNMQIQKELEKIGHMVDKRQIHIDDQIRNLGAYNVTLKLHENVNPVIKVFVQDEAGNIEPPKKAKKTEEAAVESTDEEKESDNSEAPVAE